MDQRHEYAALPDAQARALKVQRETAPKAEKEVVGRWPKYEFTN